MVSLELFEQAASQRAKRGVDACRVHLYGKGPKPGRKVGHLSGPARVETLSVVEDLVARSAPTPS